MGERKEKNALPTQGGREKETLALDGSRWMPAGFGDTAVVVCI